MRLMDLSWTQIAINFIYQQDFTDETDFSPWDYSLYFFEHESLELHE